MVWQILMEAQMSDLKQLFLDTFNKKSRVLQSVDLNGSQKEQLDLLANLLNDLSSDELELSIECFEMNMAIGVSGSDRRSYVPFIIGADKILNTSFVKLDLVETNPEPGENRFDLKDNQEIFVEALANELSARSERYIQVKAVADYLSQKP